MDSQPDVEELRSQLKSMPRAQVRRLALSAGLSCSTVEKFRGGHITEPGAFKVSALRTALQAERPAARQGRAPKAKTGAAG